MRFVKSVGAKIFDATETAAAPHEQWEPEAGKHGLDGSQVEVKSARKAVLSGSDATTEEAEKIAPATDDPVGVAASKTISRRPPKPLNRSFIPCSPAIRYGRSRRPNMATSTP